MPFVRVKPAGVDLRISEGESLLDAAFRLGYRWPTSCFGQARCSQCHVVVLEGSEHLSSIDEEEQALLERLRRFRYRNTEPEGPLRLACRLSVSGNVVVRQEQLTEP